MLRSVEKLSVGDVFRYKDDEDAPRFIVESVELTGRTMVHLTYHHIADGPPTHRVMSRGIELEVER